MRRMIQSSSEEEEGPNKGEEDEEYVPQSPAEIVELSRATCEGVRRKLRSLEEITALSKPKIIAVTTLEGHNRLRVLSPGMKRGREEGDEESGMDVEEGTEEDEEDDGSYLSSRDSSALRSIGTQEQPEGPKLKRRKRGRPAKIPGHEGMFTADKIRQRAKARELEVVEEKEIEILDPKVRATTVRAEAVDRHARMILDDLRELPTPELTERALQAIEAIKKVASTSKNIKGAFVGALWRSSEELTALSLAYSSRLRAMENEGRKEGESGELEKLRSELSMIRTEQALMVGENKRLRGQVEELRARVVLGEAPASTPPPPTGFPKRNKGKGGKKGKKEIISDSTSTDEEMEYALERELSREERMEGIKARKEVKEDRERGTLPPAIRPAIQGRTRVLDGELWERETPTPPSPVARPQKTSSLEPSKGLSQEDIVRLIQTISHMLPQLGGGMVRKNEKEERAQSQQGPNKKNPAVNTAPDKEVGGDGQDKGKKKTKRKRKKGKGGSVSQQGGLAPKGPGSPSPAPKVVPLTKGPTPLPRDKSSAPPSLDRTNTSGGEQRSRLVPGKPGPR